MKKILIYLFIFMFLFSSIGLALQPGERTGESPVKKPFLFSLSLLFQTYSMYGEARQCDTTPTENPPTWGLVTSANDGQVVTCPGLLNIYNLDSTGDYAIIDELGRDTFPATWTVWVPIGWQRVWECYNCPYAPCESDSDCVGNPFGNKCNREYGNEPFGTNVPIGNCYTADCVEDWDCGSWTSCVNGWQTRECTDRNECGTAKNKPIDGRSCVAELDIDLISYSIVDNDITPSDELVIRAKYRASVAGNYLLEAFVEPDTIFAIFGIYKIGINRCDIEAGVSEHPRFKNERVYFNAGETRDIEFVFIPTFSEGNYKAYVDVLPDCRSSDYLVPNTYIGSFTLSTTPTTTTTIPGVTTTTIPGEPCTHHLDRTSCCLIFNCRKEHWVCPTKTYTYYCGSSKHCVGGECVLKDTSADEIAVVYIYKDGSYNSNWKTKTSAVLASTKTRFKGLTTKDIKFNYISSPLKTNYNYPLDLTNEGWLVIRELIRDLYSNYPEFQTMYNNNDGMLLIVEDTHGASYSVDYKSPILIDSSVLDVSNGDILMTHEILHSYGLRDYCISCPIGIPPGCENDIMANLQNPNNYLCPRSQQDFGVIRKTALSEYGIPFTTTTTIPGEECETEIISSTCFADKSGFYETYRLSDCSTLETTHYCPPGEHCEEDVPGFIGVTCVPDIPPTDKPNFQLQFVDVPSEAKAGDTISVDVRITNNGGTGSMRVETGIYYDKTLDDWFEGSGLFAIAGAEVVENCEPIEKNIQTKQITLNTGESGIETFTFKIPESICSPLGGLIKTDKFDIYSGAMERCFNTGQATGITDAIRQNIKIEPTFGLRCGTCSDGLQNGDETDTDCGGKDCDPCRINYMCELKADCEGDLVCKDGRCSEPEPTDECIPYPHMLPDFSFAKDCSPSYTKKEFKDLPLTKVVKSICEGDENCKPRENYEVECVKHESAGLERGLLSIRDRILIPDNVCLASKEKIDICGFLEPLAFFSLTGDDCIDGGIIVFGGIILLFLIMGMFQRR